MKRGFVMRDVLKTRALMWMIGMLLLVAGCNYAFGEGMNDPRTEGAETAAEAQATTVSADEALADLERAILFRKAHSHDDLQLSVDGEVEILDKYRNATIDDAAVDEALKLYIQGIALQKGTLDAGYDIYECRDTDWWQGTVYRFQALEALYNGYGFMKDNEDFVATYIGKSESNARNLDLTKSVYEDVNAEINSPDFQPVITDDGEMVITLTNHTEYAYSGELEVKRINPDGAVVDIIRISIDDFAAGTTQEFSGMIGTAEDIDHCEYRFLLFG